MQPTACRHPPHPAAGKFGAFWVKDGRVVGAFLEGGSAGGRAGRGGGGWGHRRRCPPPPANSTATPSPPDEFGAIKKAVQQRAAAPADLASQGLAWAAKL